MAHRFRFLAINVVLALTLGASHWGRRAESAPAPPADFLRQLRLPFRNWSESERNLTAAELDMLQPDATLVRRYRSAGSPEIELAVIAGRKKRSVHTPGYCLAGGGWETLAQETVMLPLPGRPTPAVRALVARDRQRVLVTYFFTDGEFSTSSLPRFQAMQLLRRIRSEAPLGALVRVTVAAPRDAASVARLSDEFAQATLPAVLEALARTRRSLK